MEFQIINDNGSLAEYCQQSKGAEFISLDTEFVRTRTWYPQCGLIQINNGKRIVLVDPLTISDWQPLKDILVAPDIVKVLHSCSEDLEVFSRLLGVYPAPIFDTQFAACLAGLGNTLGYAKLIQDLLGIEVDKGESRTDWLRRPLSDTQLQYAANDVLYLHQVYPMLKSKIDALGRFDWVLQEMATLSLKKSANLAAQYRYLLVKNAWQLNAGELAVLQELAGWRYNKAVEQDLAANFVIKEAAMLEIARRAPKSIARLAALNVLTGKEMRLYGEEILSLILTASLINEENRPEKIRRLVDIKAYKKICQSIRSACIDVAEEQNIPLEVLASKKQINQFLKWLWFDVEECKLQDIKPDLCLGWRHYLLAEVLSQYH
ncbi:ribonuclease D [Planctobacterium marinum]|uniref:ribonuclease D n=1 Tax=Planctobacterium marinum TaxID=1631968 RepID=UPI001E48EB4E|nr:ribonuclease D [Planctobacterium marinum]MCC2607381.1 ribonuclease D [Planctobacterium marinum]